MPTLNPKQKRFVAEYLIDAERFWSYVDRSGGPSACWPWRGARDASGYGKFHVGKSRNSSMGAHRVAFGLTHGELPACVRHDCDNPPCCNPAHHQGGAKGDNNRDMVARGRHWAQVDPTRAAKGSAHGSAKLTEADALAIRGLYAAKTGTQRDLAAQYDVSQRTICKIVNGTGWAHV